LEITYLFIALVALILFRLIKSLRARTRNVRVWWVYIPIILNATVVLGVMRVTILIFVAIVLSSVPIFLSVTSVHLVLVEFNSIYNRFN
jgi:hypothetical protein